MLKTKTLHCGKVARSTRFSRDNSAFSNFNCKTRIIRCITLDLSKKLLKGVMKLKKNISFQPGPDKQQHSYRKRNECKRVSEKLWIYGDQTISSDYIVPLWPRSKQRIFRTKLNWTDGLSGFHSSEHNNRSKHCLNELSTPFQQSVVIPTKRNRCRRENFRRMYTNVIFDSVSLWKITANQIYF